MTRSQARSLIMEGRVRVAGQVVTKAGRSTKLTDPIDVERPRRFVSRGGEKLERALDTFGIDATGRVALDVGASTGGFTDCLLQRGAAHVTAVDVGYGQLDWKLRNDARVRVMERTNFRLLGDDAFPSGFDLIVIDASFISVRTIVERARTYLRPEGAMAALIKPQFEAGRERVGGGGVVRDPEVHRAVLREVLRALEALRIAPVRLIASPLLGPAG
ncbi:MAG TPA: TlyA family RNA methyltransferase, partial [Casimicrobiaceae bacterium]